jgi:hypothetical protein
MIFVYEFLLAELLVVIMVPVTRLAEKILCQRRLVSCMQSNFGLDVQDNEVDGKLQR